MSHQATSDSYSAILIENSRRKKLSAMLALSSDCLTFKRRRFKCPVLSADRNFLWEFKRLLLWVGKY
jgi:hypothetical protein